MGVSLPSLAVAVNPANRLDGLLVNQYTGLPVWRFSWALRFHADGRKFTGLLVSWFAGKPSSQFTDDADGGAEDEHVLFGGVE